MSCLHLSINYKDNISKISLIAKNITDEINERLTKMQLKKAVYALKEKQAIIGELIKYSLTYGPKGDIEFKKLINNAFENEAESLTLTYDELEKYSNSKNDPLPQCKEATSIYDKYKIGIRSTNTNRPSDSTLKFFAHFLRNFTSNNEKVIELITLNKGLGSAFSKSKTQVSDLLQKYSDQQKALEELESDLSTLHESNEKTVAENADLRKQYELQNNELYKTISGKNKTIETLKQNLSALTNENIQLKEQLKNTQMTISRNIQDKAGQEIKNNTNEEDVNQLKLHASDLEKQLETLRIQHKKLEEWSMHQNDTISILNAEQEDLKNLDAFKLKTAVEELQKQNADLENEIQCYKLEAEDLTIRCENLKVAHKNIDTEYKEMNKIYSQHLMKHELKKQTLLEDHQKLLASFDDLTIKYDKLVEEHKHCTDVNEESILTQNAKSLEKQLTDGELLEALNYHYRNGFELENSVLYGCDQNMPIVSNYLSLFAELKNMKDIFEKNITELFDYQNKIVDIIQTGGNENDGALLYVKLMKELIMQKKNQHDLQLLIKNNKILKYINFDMFNQIRCYKMQLSETTTELHSNMLKYNGFFRDCIEHLQNMMGVKSSNLVSLNDKNSFEYFVAVVRILVDHFKAKWMKLKQLQIENTRPTYVDNQLKLEELENQDIDYSDDKENESNNIIQSENLESGFNINSSIAELHDKIKCLENSLSG